MSKSVTVTVESIQHILEADPEAIAKALFTFISAFGKVDAKPKKGKAAKDESEDEDVEEEDVEEEAEDEEVKPAKKTKPAKAGKDSADEIIATATKKIAAKKEKKPDLKAFVHNVTTGHVVGSVPKEHVVLTVKNAEGGLVCLAFKADDHRIKIVRDSGKVVSEGCADKAPVKPKGDKKSKKPKEDENGRWVLGHFVHDVDEEGEDNGVIGRLKKDRVYELTDEDVEELGDAPHERTSQDDLDERFQQEEAEDGDEEDGDDESEELVSKLAGGVKALTVSEPTADQYAKVMGALRVDAKLKGKDLAKKAGVPEAVATEVLAKPAFYAKKFPTVAGAKDAKGTKGKNLPEPEGSDSD
jgi:hypothetical protein